MFEYSELNQNITNGETSIVGTIAYNGWTYSVRGQFSHRWSRKTVDGRLTTDNPHEDITFTLMLGQLAQMGALNRVDYRQFVFTISDKSYGVKNTTGDNPITFYLVEKSEYAPHDFEVDASNENPYEGKGDIV